MKPEPEDALADALVEVSELVVAMGDPRADRDELEARLLEIARKYGEATHPFDRPISGLLRWH